VYGIAVGTGRGPDGELTAIVYAVNGAGRLQRFLPDGTLVGAFAPDADLNQPRMVEVHPTTNEVYVVNARDREIVVFDADGHERLRFGTNGTQPGSFMGDHRGIAISPDGQRIYVADEGNHRVQVLDPDGRYLTELSGATEGAEDYLVDARGLDVAPDGTVVVSDEWDFSLKEWSADRRFLGKTFGGAAGIGGVNSPRGMGVDSAGRVLVSDWWNQRVHRWDADGANPYAWRFRGTTDEPCSINSAWDVAVQAGTDVSGQP
jgi:DNA-binding beta-propeller fold protein YncE